MRIVITGAARGIGAAAAVDLAEQYQNQGSQLDLLLTARQDSDELADVARQAQALGAEVATFAADLAQADAADNVAAAARQALGGVDAIVCNAGVCWPGLLKDLSVEDWATVMDINVRSVWQLARALHDTLSENKGCIITVGSQSGVMPQHRTGAYSVSKAGIIMLTRLMAQEWAPDGIRANCVSPGMVLTPMTEGAYADADFKSRREAMVPAGRIADPKQDIAGVISFLLSPAAHYITGQNIVVDGGMTEAILSVLPVRTK